MNSAARYKFRMDEWIILLLSVCFVIYQLAFYKTLGFHRDELLYFSLGEHLAFGFQSVPPFVGFLAFVSAKLFGFTLFAAKFFPAIAGGMVVFVSAQIAKELNGGTYSQILTVIGLSGSILFGRAFSLFQPVCFDILFWTVSFWLIIRFINTNHNKYLLYLGLSFGLAILNKYNIVFLVIALLLVIPFTKYRKLFTEKQVYISVLIAVLVAAPNLIWQVVNHFPVIRHMAELRRSQLVNVSDAQFLIDQLLMIFPATLMAFPGLLFLFFSRQMKKFLLPAIMSVVVVLLYLLLHGKGYYAAGIYPFLIAAGGVFYEKVLKKVYLQVFPLIVLLYLSWIMLPMGKPIYGPEKLVQYFDKMQAVTGDNSIRRFEDNSYHKLPQDYADMLGWDELAEITNQAWQQVENKNSCIIYCENYGEAGAIAILGKKYGLPEPLCFNDAFRYWIPKKFDHEINSMIYINGEPGEDVKELFGDIQKIGQISNPLAREFGCGVYLCRSPRRSLNTFWKERVKRVLEN